MDHLPVASTGTVEGLETVPYVCEKPYDGGPFLTYPIREDRPEFVSDADSAGKQLLLEYGRLHSTPNKVFESFCQTWLFFGLITEIVGDICQPTDFIRRGEGSNSKFISTSRLPGLIRRWMTSVENGSSPMTYEHVTKCLWLTYLTLQAARPEFDSSVKLCIASVGELFSYATNIAFGIENPVLNNKCPAPWHLLVGKTPWIQPLGASGWCPSQIEIVTSSLSSLQTLHFYASMKAPALAGRHNMCDDLKCVAYQTNLTNYKPRHVNEECQCEEFYMSSLNAVLSTGAIALLRIREAERLDELTVDIVASEPDSCYLALSHVWADGLGNAKANALPRCQLRRLSRLANRLRVDLDPEKPQVELLLWCDTLCCPLAPREARDRVLEQMRNIYERAKCVLVLDASLLLYESAAMRQEEICARILFSGWMRRLWTLQEGALPAPKKRLWLQFRDQALNFYPLWWQIADLFNNDWSQRGLASDLLVRMTYLIDFFHPERFASLYTVDGAFKHRSVSNPLDEPLLIGTLLGLNVASILNGSDETRMRRMWSLMPTAVHGLPKNILFRLGPRLGETGYRWAPSTMRYYESNNVVLGTAREGDDKGTPTEHGLTVRLSGYHMSFPQRPRGLPVNLWNTNLDENLLYMRDEEANWYLVSRRWTGADGDYLSKDRFSNVMRSRTDLWVALLETGFHARSDSIPHTRIALITTLLRETDEVKYVNSYMHISFGRQEQSLCEMFDAAYRCAQRIAESDPAQRLANVSDEEIDMELPDYKALIDALKSEIHRVAVSGDFDVGVRLARQRSGKDDDVLFEEVVSFMFLRRYAIIGPKTPEIQQWCVD